MTDGPMCTKCGSFYTSYKKEASPIGNGAGYCETCNEYFYIPTDADKADMRETLKRVFEYIKEHKCAHHFSSPWYCTRDGFAPCKLICTGTECDYYVKEAKTNE